MSRLWLAVGVTAALALASLLLGARPGIGPADLWALVVAPDPGDAAGIVVREMRLPRTLAGLLVGGALGAAGALMQTLTRNPLADPGLLGINAGAAFAIVATISLAGPTPPAELFLPAVAGAGATALLVWAFGAAGAGPAALILAGAAVTAMLLALVRALILIDQATLDAYRHWAVGSLGGVGPPVLIPALPLVAAGIVATVLATRRLDALALGDDMGRALGVGVALTRAVTLAAVAGLAAAAVLVAGPMGFVGLVVPHLARGMGAVRSGEIAWLSACFGAALVLAADIAGRMILPGLVIEAGLGVALIGGPALVWIVRRDTRLAT